MRVADGLVPMSPTLIVICGLPGAGKTTLAKQIEHDLPALRLTPDDWMTALSINCGMKKRGHRSSRCNGSLLNEH